MSQPEPRAAHEPTSPVALRGHGDPWQAFGYVVAGVGVYGFAGYWLDRWWGTSFMVVVGILAGAGLGIYMTFGRFGRTDPSQPTAPHQHGPPLREQD